MSRFYASLHGAGNRVQRDGTEQSGMHVMAKSYQAQVSIYMHTSSADNRDYVRVTLNAPDGGHEVVLYDGPCDGWQEYAQAGELGRLAWKHQNIPKKE